MKSLAFRIVQATFLLIRFVFSILLIDTKNKIVCVYLGIIQVSQSYVSLHTPKSAELDYSTVHGQ